MIGDRRLFVRKALTAAGGIFVASCLPEALYAGCKQATGVFFLGQPIPDRKLGDCEMKPLLIHLGPTGEGYFKTQVATHFTHGKDVWHLRLQILSYIRGTQKEQHTWLDKTFDGPSMSEKDVPLFHDWTETFTFPAEALQPPAPFLGAFLQLTDCC